MLVVIVIMIVHAQSVMLILIMNVASVDKRKEYVSLLQQGSILRMGNWSKCLNYRLEIKYK